MAWTLIWLTTGSPAGLTELQNATSDATVLACFDDDNNGTPNATALTDVCTRAEMHTLSWLDEYGPPPFNSTVLANLGADPFLKTAAQERAVILMYDRAPEAVRQAYGDLEKRRKDWDAMMTRIKDGRQRPPTVPQVPANIGGFYVDGANRIYIDNPDGTQNSGDY